jgi:DNA-binding NarL/FixJ family response regulator
MPDPLRIVLAEDSYLVREGTRQLLELGDDVSIDAAVGTATELLTAVDAIRPDAVLTDVRMPPGNAMDGIDAAKDIRTRHPKTGVVVLSQHADESYAMALISDGAEGLGYLLKERVSNRAQLVDALRTTAAGGSVMDPLLVDAMFRRQRLGPRSSLANLTERELEVLREMASGGSNASIAATLSLSQSSIEKHVNAIFAKLGLAQETTVHRRVSAVVTYLREWGH